MADPRDHFTPHDSQASAGSGPDRRSGLDRRRDPNPVPPPGQPERRLSVRRKKDRIFLEEIIRIGEPGPGGRLFRRAQIQVPVICRLLGTDSPPRPPLRGLTHSLASGGLGMLLEEEHGIGTLMEVLVRFDGDLVSADVQVVNVNRQGAGFLHNCRFTRLGTADRMWLMEYVRVRDAPSA